MKKTISIILVILTIVSLFSAVPVSAYSITEDGFKYSIQTASDYTKYVYISEYCGTAENVEIPSEIEGYPVYVLGGHAFYNNLSVVNVKIPDTVESFSSTNPPYNNEDTHTFAGCTSLKSVNVPKNLKRVLSEAFYGCISLENVEIGDGVEEIYGEAFGNCKGLKQITLPESITYISTSAFSGCTNLESLTIGSYISEFELKDTDFAKSLKNVTVTYRATTIGEAVFAGCSKLENVTFGKNMQTIKKDAFYSCVNLSDITLPDGLKNIEENAFRNCKKLASVTIPSSVTNIDKTAFADDPYLTIYCEAGTYAESYAKANGYDYVILGTDVKLNSTSTTLYAMETFTIVPIITDGLGVTTYVSSNPKVATVDTEGVITAVRKGVATISVTNNNVSRNFEVTVNNPYLNVTKKNLKAAETFSLDITGKVGTPQFKSSNNKVVTVDSNGKMKAVKKGNATVFVYTNGINLECTVTVVNPELNATKKTLYEKEKFGIKIINKVGAPNFISSNKKVATVSKSGEVTAKKNGTATITVKTNGMTLKCKITVKGYYEKYKGNWSGEIDYMFGPLYTDLKIKFVKGNKITFFVKQRTPDVTGKTVINKTTITGKVKNNVLKFKHKDSKFYWIGSLKFYKNRLKLTLDPGTKWSLKWKLYKVR